MWGSIGTTKTTSKFNPVNAAVATKNQPKHSTSEEESEDTEEETSTDTEDDDTSYYLDKVENLVLSFLTEFMHFQSYDPADAMDAEIPFLCNLRRKLQLMNHVMRKFESKLQRFLKVQVLHDLIELTKDPRNSNKTWLKPWVKVREIVLQFSDKIKNPSHSKRTPEIRAKILCKLIADLKSSPYNLKEYNSGSESSASAEILEESPKVAQALNYNRTLNQLSLQDNPSSAPPSAMVNLKKFTQSPRGKTAQLDFSYYPFPPFSTKALEIFARVKIEEASDRTPTVPPPSRQASCCNTRTAIGMYDNFGAQRKINPEAATKDILIRRDQLASARPFQNPNNFIVPTAAAAAAERNRTLAKGSAWNGMSFETNPVRTPVFGAMVKKSWAACPWFRIPGSSDKSDLEKDSSKTPEVKRETADRYAGSCHPSRRFGFMSAVETTLDSKPTSPSKPNAWNRLSGILEQVDQRKVTMNPTNEFSRAFPDLSGVKDLPLKSPENTMPNKNVKENQNVVKEQSKPTASLPTKNLPLKGVHGIGNTTKTESEKFDISKKNLHEMWHSQAGLQLQNPAGQRGYYYPTQKFSIQFPPTTTKSDWRPHTEMAGNLNARGDFSPTTPSVYKPILQNRPTSGWFVPPLQKMSGDSKQDAKVTKKTHEETKSIRNKATSPENSNKQEQDLHNSLKMTSKAKSPMLGGQLKIGAESGTGAKTERTSPSVVQPLGKKTLNSEVKTHNQSQVQIAKTIIKNYRPKAFDFKQTEDRAKTSLATTNEPNSTQAPNLMAGKVKYGIEQIKKKLLAPGREQIITTMAFNGTKSQTASKKQSAENLKFQAPDMRNKQTHSTGNSLPFPDRNQTQKLSSKKEQVKSSNNVAAKVTRP